jgi:hypothetical protein
MRELKRRNKDWPQKSCELCGKIEGVLLSERHMVWRSTGGWSWGFRTILFPPGSRISDCKSTNPAENIAQAVQGLATDPDTWEKQEAGDFSIVKEAISNSLYYVRPKSNTVHVTCDECTIHYQEIAKTIDSTFKDHYMPYAKTMPFYCKCEKRQRDGSWPRQIYSYRQKGWVCSKCGNFKPDEDN